MEYHEDPQGAETGPELEEAEEEKEFSFMQETIKDENWNGKRIRNLILKYAGFGLVFGMAASLGFFALKPWAESRFQNNPDKVTIPAEEEEQETQEEQSVVVDQALTVDNYRELNQALVKVGESASRFVVHVIAETAETSWEMQGDDQGKSVSGILLADNGKELLIFAKSIAIQDVSGFKAEFYDGKVYNASLKVKDENLGFAVFAVDKAEVSDALFNSVQIAALGSSNAMNRGDVVIALGSPFSYSDGMGFGIVASDDNVVQKMDGEYKLLTTDIAGTSDGTGVLVNIRGEVVGMVDQTVLGEQEQKLVTAYGISNLKMILEILSNGDSVPYIGIRGMTITETVAGEQGIPQGVYVQEVAADSPAMEAGIQSGDIITKMGKEEIELLSVYNSRLLELQVGDKVKIKGKRQGAGGYVDIDFTVTVGNKE